MAQGLSKARFLTVQEVANVMRVSSMTVYRLIKSGELSAAYKAGVRAFPNLVPDRPDAPGAALSRQARDFWRNAWTGKSLMAIGMKDPVLGPPVMRALHATIRNCPQPIEIAEGGHFLQEWGEGIARIACDTL